MRLTFCLYDEENLEECFNEQFNIYCSSELLKSLKLSNGENAVIQHKPKDSELSHYAYCCFKNYAELKIKNRKDTYSVYTVMSVLKSLGINMKQYSTCPSVINENKSNKNRDASVEVTIKKGEIFIPIKEVELHIIETDFERTMEIYRDYYKNVQEDKTVNLWDNMRNKNIDTYLNLCLLNVCLFEKNIIKLSLLGVSMNLMVKGIFLRSKKENNKLISENICIPYVAHNTKIILKDEVKEKQHAHQKEEERAEEEEDEGNISFGKTGFGLLKTETSKYKIKQKKGLKKIGGYKQMKDDIYYYVLLPLIYKRVYDLFHIDVNRGILLHGPPGCGKTFVALAIKEELEILQKRINRLKTKNAVADTEKTNVEKRGNGRELKKDLKEELKGEHEQILKLMEQKDVEIKLPEMEIIKSTDLIDINNNGEKINELFIRCCKRYREEGRCSIIFIDEIEILCEKRDNVNMNLYTTALLNNMDGVKKNTHTILIGATNFINKIDLALRRSGRFDREIEVSVPNLKDRIKILKKKLNNVSHNLTHKKIRYVADLCQSFTCSDITALINTAIYKSLRERNVINNDLFKGEKEKKGKTEKIKENKNIELGEERNTPPEIYHNNSPVILTYQHIMKSLQLIKPSGMKELYVDIPQTKIKSIGGYKFVKKCIKECLIYPKKFKKIYQQYNIQSPKGILLYGPPGCSKTLFAKAIASEINMNFISVKGPEIFSKYVGESEKTIRYIFKKARENNPCVIFFDEIDSIAMNRNLNQNFVSNRVLCQLLNEIDGIYNRLNVVILAATNRPDLIDPALLRPGRFDRIIYVPLPNYKSRISIFRKTLKFYKTNCLLNIYDEGENQVKSVKEENDKNKNQLKYVNEKRYFELQVDEEKYEKEKKTEDNGACQNLSFTENIKFASFKKENNFTGTKEKMKSQKTYKNEKERDLEFLELCRFLAQRTKKYSGAEIVNLCREASICALRETLIVAKREKNAKKNIENENEASDDKLSPSYLTALSKKHFIKVLNRMKPQTPDALIHFYKQYSELK